MHNDEPALQDTLERRSLIEEVGEAIARCTPPQVFGVHGDWGLGKTSFLHQVQWYLTGDCPQQPESVTGEMKKQAKNAADDTPTQKCGVYKEMAQAVWFDAWRYQNEAAPVVALLHEMRTQLSWGSRVGRSTRRSAKVAVRGALLSMEELTRKIGLQYSTFHQASRAWEAENLAAALPSHTLREHLRAAVEQLLPRKKRDLRPPKLVVFIDDVDRCEPDAAYRLLEGLKIYLTLDNCVFVLGMNQKAIEEAIAQRMKAETSDDPTMRAAAYTEKLCQNVWRLPALRQPEQVLYGLLEETVKDENVQDWIKRGIEEPKSKYRCLCLPPNPRRLKGLANLIGRLSSRLPVEESDATMVFETQLLMIVACICQFHHDLYVRWESDPSLYHKIREWCRGVDPRLPFFESLKLPLHQMDRDSTEPTPDFGSTYPDPAAANVFWAQPLVLHLAEVVVPEEHFGRYLHGLAS